MQHLPAYCPFCLCYITASEAGRILSVSLGCIKGKEEGTGGDMASCGSCCYCCCSDPQLNALGVTQYTCKCTVTTAFLLGKRTRCVTVLFNALQHGQLHTVFRGFISSVDSYARSSPWLTIVSTQLCSTQHHLDVALVFSLASTSL